MPTLDDGRVSTTNQADAGWDTYAERVTRNEGRLDAFEALLREMRDADRRLIEQRSDSLAAEMERRADALRELTVSQRDCDRSESREAWVTGQEHQAERLALLREMYDTAITKNYEQSTEALRALQEKVGLWRESDHEARLIQVKEYDAHFDRLNHAHERQEDFQAKAVTRELFMAEVAAQQQRESVIRDSIVTLEKAGLGMSTIVASDKAQQVLRERIDKAIDAAAATLDAKITTLTDKVADLKDAQSARLGRSSGYEAVYGWAIAAVALVISAVVAVNALLA